MSGALQGAVVVGGAGVVGASLFSMGIPKHSVLQCELALKNDKFLLLVSGSAMEVAKAKEMLGTSQPAHLEVHSDAAVAAAKPSLTRSSCES